MGKIRIAVTLILVSTIFPALSHAGESCGEKPEKFATEIYSRLESTRDPDALERVYENNFSPMFRNNFPFEIFYQNLVSIQDRLGVGEINGRSLQKRRLTIPTIVDMQQMGASKNNDPSTINRSASEYPIGALLTLEFFTSSGVGKVRQTIQIICWRNGWQVQGIWYMPYG